MKKLLFVTVLGCFTAFQVNAQEKTHDKAYDNGKTEMQQTDVPQTVKSAFTSQFADASNVEWKKKGDSYKVKFEKNGTKHMAELNNSGQVVSKGMEIEESALPSAISTAVKNNYSSDKIKEAYRVEKDGKTMYKVKMEGDDKKKLVFDEQGNKVKEIQK